MENRETKRTKVALIDSGVVVVGGPRDDNHHEGKREKEGKGREKVKARNASGSVLAQRIVEGISLVSRDNEEQPWWHATEPHGTQMATLICSINPFCDLYVVKVAESNASGITGPNVAKVRAISFPIISSLVLSWKWSKRINYLSFRLSNGQEVKVWT